MDEQRQQDRKQAIIIAAAILAARDLGDRLAKPAMSRARIFSKSRPFSQSAQTPRIWAN
jgi:hypothetical protein